MIQAINFIILNCLYNLLFAVMNAPVYSCSIAGYPSMSVKWLAVNLVLSIFEYHTP